MNRLTRWPGGRVGRLLPVPFLLLVALPLNGQGGDEREETRRIREASRLEWQGRIPEAERVLQDLLEAFPTSSGGLFALERVLRNQGRVGEILPRADRFLDRDPTASSVRYMKLRVLVEVDSLTALDGEARAWFRNEPGSADPYREVARLYQRALGDRAALELLEEGRRALGEEALALELGDARARMGDGAGAVREWAVALRDPGAELTSVLGRVERLDGDVRRLVGPLLEALVTPPTDTRRREAAVRVALNVGLSDRALELARGAVEEIPRGDRRSFLSAVARQAEEAGDPVVALWALEGERELAPSRDRPTLDVRLAAVALQAGDTARAVEARSRLARELPVGSVERRRVMGELIRVEAASASAETLVARLEDFAREYPDAPEQDELRAAAIAGLAGRGRMEEARALVARGDGPLTALESGYLHFQAGEVEAGSLTIQDALPALAPSHATKVLRLLSFLSRVGDQAALPLAEAAAWAHQGRAEVGVEVLVEALGTAAEGDRPTLMAWAGELAQEAGETARAGELYATLVEVYPGAPEFPSAALALARIRIEEGALDEARAVLERLILERPDSPVVPAARRELQRVRTVVSGTGAGREDG